MVSLPTFLKRQLRSLSGKRPDDWKVILLCVAVAAVIWFLNKLNKDYTTRLNYPLEVVYDPAQVVPVAEVPRRIDINVTGYGWNLLRRSSWLQRTPLRYEPDNLPYADYVTAGQLVPLLREQLPDLDLNFVAQDTIFLPFEARVRRRIAVRIDSQNISLASNYRIVTPLTLTPDSIAFVGAASLLAKLPPIFLIQLPDRNVSGDYDEKIAVEYPQTELVRLEEQRVRVSFRTARFERQRMLVPVRVINGPARSVLRDSVVELSYVVNAALPRALTADSFTVVANYRQLNQDSTLTPRLVRAPAGVFDPTFSPEALHLRGSL